MRAFTAVVATVLCLGSASASTSQGPGVAPTFASPTTLTSTYSVWPCNAAGGNVGITVPPGPSYPNQVWTIKKTDSSSNACIINMSVGNTLDGASSLSLTSPNQSVTIVNQYGQAAWFTTGNGVAVGTSGSVLCLVNTNCTFSGAGTAFLAQQFSASPTIVTTTCSLSTTSTTLTGCGTIAGIVPGMTVADETTQNNIAGNVTVVSASGSSVVISADPANAATDTLVFTLPLVNARLGTGFSFSGTPYMGVEGEFQLGSAGSPDTSSYGPLFKFSRYHNWSGTQCQQSSCSAVLNIGAQGGSTDYGSTYGLNIGVSSSSIECGACATSGMHVQAYETGNGVSKASAGDALIENKTNDTAPGFKGFEYDLDDDSTTGEDCLIKSGYFSGDGNCDGGVMLNSGGTWPYSAALHIGGSTGFYMGIVFNNGSIVNSCGGGSNLCGVTINDQSSSTTSINIGGTHTNAINIGSGGGNVLLGGNVLATGGGNISLCGSFSGTGSPCTTGATLFGMAETLGNPTGGAEGNGTLNATGYYANGTAGITGSTCTQWTLGLCTHS